MKLRCEHVLFTGAAVLLAAAAVCWTRPLPFSETIPAPCGSSREFPIMESPAEKPFRGPAVWRPPGFPKERHAWIFELFTPPAVYLDAQAGFFRLEPPRPGQEKPDEAHALQLAGFADVLYRLQYHGYAGEAGGYLINLKNEEKQSWLVGKTGQDFPELDFTIRGFDPPKNGPGNGAILRIFDHRLNKEVALTDEPLYEPGRIARLTSDYAPGTVIKAAENETFQTATGTYRVLKIDCAASKVVLERAATGPDKPETIVLRLSPFPP